MILTALLETLVDVITAFGFLVGFCFIFLWAWVGGEELMVWWSRRQRWGQITQAREALAEDFEQEESVAAFDFPEREHTTERRAS